LTKFREVTPAARRKNAKTVINFTLAFRKDFTEKATAINIAAATAKTMENATSQNVTAQIAKTTPSKHNGIILKLNNLFIFRNLPIYILGYYPNIKFEYGARPYSLYQSFKNTSL
jgi:hypothetical protein